MDLRDSLLLPGEGATCGQMVRIKAVPILPKSIGP